MAGAGISLVVSILISQGVSFELHNVISDKFGRYVIISGKLYNTLVVLLPDLNTYSLILGGDFNCWLDPILDRSSTNPSTASRSVVSFSLFSLTMGSTMCGAL